MNIKDRVFKFIGPNKNIRTVELEVYGITKQGESLDPGKKYVISMDNPKIISKEVMDGICTLLNNNGNFEEVFENIQKSKKSKKSKKEG